MGGQGALKKGGFYRSLTSHLQADMMATQVCLHYCGCDAQFSGAPIFAYRVLLVQILPVLPCMT